jgi:hypothetical protein
MAEEPATKTEAPIMLSSMVRSLAMAGLAWSRSAVAPPNKAASLEAEEIVTCRPTVVFCMTGASAPIKT